MHNDSINNLLKELDEATFKCNKLVTLTESSTFDKIQNSILGLQKIMLNSIKTANPAYMSQDTIDLINKVRTIPITDAYKVATYPNIHNEIKYDIRAGVIIDYVLKKIDDSIKNPNVEFDPIKINKEAIAYAFKTLTGRSNYTEMTPVEFREAYKLHAFGGNKRILIYPRVNVLTILCARTPIILNHIDDKLIYRHIKSLREYALEVNTHFNKLILSQPELSNQLNKYIECIEMAIKNIVRLYKGIRTVFVDLDIEYKHIFRELISMDKEFRGSNMYESITNFTNNAIKNINDIRSTLHDNGPLNESYDGIINNQESLTIESLNKFHKSFLLESIKNCKERSESLDYITSNMCLVSSIQQSDNSQIFTISSINTEIPDDLLKICDEYDTKKIIISKRDLVERIFNDTNYFELVSDDENNFVNKTLNNISNTMIGNKTYIIPNVEILANNLLKIQKYMKKINETVEKLCISVSDIITLMINKFNNNEDIEDNLLTINNYYLVYITILNCIYKNLSIIGDESIKTIKNMR